MGRTPASLLRLSRFLRTRGHCPARLGYVAALETFDTIRNRVAARLQRLAQTGEEYAALGHSLGGLALRAALPGIEPAPRHLVFLGTPNQSPLLARRLRAWFLYRTLCGESGQLLANPQFFSQLPWPGVPYTIIAGSGGRRGRWSPFRDEINDGLVAVKETKISPGDEPIVLNVGHTFMMNNGRVRQLIAEVLDRPI
jgi:hypothetical protein